VAGPALGSPPGTSPSVQPSQHVSHLRVTRRVRRVSGIGLAATLTAGLLGLALVAPGTSGAVGTSVAPADRLALQTPDTQPTDPSAGPSSTGPSSTGPSSTGPSSTGPSSTGPSSTGPSTSPTTATDPATDAPTTTAAVVTDRRWRLFAGGDALLRRRTNADPFARIRPPLREADLSIVNVETAISTSGTPQAKTFVFRAEPRFAELLSQAGVDAVSLANNHAMDYGRDAMLETIEHLRSNAVTPFGAGANISEALEPARFTVKGTRISIIGASQIIPAGSWVASDERGGIASAGKHQFDRNTMRVLDAVRTAKADSDVVIVFMHWGIEGDDCPSGVQVKLGRLLREAGATAVIGAHPHVLQPIVPDPSTALGNGVIAYSLGNFIWDPRGGKTGDTGVLELDFDGTNLLGIELHPHRLDGNGWAAAVSNEGTANRIKAAVSRRCSQAEGEFSWGDTTSASSPQS
jgi:poly-gamma-glutamate capsule biosynthesis protein CapA/YwtB (metallophosphatase superfamily)